MLESYTEIESHITKAIAALNTRKNAKLRAIAREFEVPRERLRSRYHGPHLNQRYEDCILDV